MSVSPGTPGGPGNIPWIPKDNIQKGVDKGNKKPINKDASKLHEQKKLKQYNYNLVKKIITEELRKNKK
jgi:hypothetical protein